MTKLSGRKSKERGRWVRRRTRRKREREGGGVGGKEGGVSS